jgi:hypothetical protein
MLESEFGIVFIFDLLMVTTLWIPYVNISRFVLLFHWALTCDQIGK